MLVFTLVNTQPAWWGPAGAWWGSGVWGGLLGLVGPAGGLLGPVAQKSNESEFCLTPECIEAAGSILKKMDRSVDPYLLKAPHLPGELEAVTKAKVLYRSCVNESQLEQLDSQPMLKTLQQQEFRWPVVGEGLGGNWQWSARRWDLQKTLAAMRILVPFEERTSENMYNKYSLSRLQRLIPQTSLVGACWGLVGVWCVGGLLGPGGACWGPAGGLVGPDGTWWGLLGPAGSILKKMDRSVDPCEDFYA
ncbi:hypothetical protein CRUP_035385, partial [Coryphaenoides rupestris]